MILVFICFDCNTSFIKREIDFMLKSKKIKKLVVFTEKKIVDLDQINHEKIKIHYSEDLNGIKLSYSHFLLKALFYQILDIIIKPVWYLRINKSSKQHLIEVFSKIKVANYINNIYQEKIIIYSYWASNDAVIAAMVKSIHKRCCSVTRLHAFDLYEEFDNKGHIPLRNLIYKKIDYLSTISKHGENYLKNKYPFTSRKVRTHYLGVSSQVDKLSYLNLRSPINIVSCGWVGQRKNVLGIYNLLKNEANLKWTHLGGGDQLQYLVDRVESEVINLEVILPGEMCNDDILNYYKNNSIDCFLSLSTNEGLPVSMMEAMAHGIPVVSTDVGGCAEIVNENTGVLLPKNYTDEDVRNAVYLCAEKFKSPESRQRIQNFIKENFDAEKNYGKFVDFLEQANNEHHSKLEND